MIATVRSGTLTLGKEYGTVSKFLVTYHGGGMPSPEQMAQARAAFGQWLSQAGNAVIDPGAPVRVVTSVANSGVPEAVGIGGYSIIEAPTADEAVRILKSHPFVARGGTLQVNEILTV
jgi:hypothetical protein